MYHGAAVPGFPQHPHRGFETVTIVRRGFIDHSDSLGATARFGADDVQWLTAGEGIVHSEMFPLLRRDAPNPLELFQIWLNLPPDSKMVPPYFTMFWSRGIPRVVAGDGAGRVTTVSVIAGELAGQNAPVPPPHSWASRAGADVAIWSIRMDPRAGWTLPPARDARTTRRLYFFSGASLRIAEQLLPNHGVVSLRSDRPVHLVNGPEGTAELLLLQGRPIGAPVVQYGPFVMNSRSEIQRAFEDYQRTRFGGWPWASDAPVHARDVGRFARHADGRIEHGDD